MLGDLMKKIILIVVMLFLVSGCNLKDEIIQMKEKVKIPETIHGSGEDTGYIENNIKIKKIDKKNYEFIYNDEVYKVLYMNDTWTIYNSYKITNSSDMKTICKELLKIHKIPSSDYKSYRTEEDMVYEWKQHNLAYQILPEGNSFRESAKDVDLDPKDQGKSLVEMYEDRTGQKLDIGKLFK